MRKVCFMMYIRKSVLSAAAMILGGAVLFLAAFLFAFTEVEIPSGVCAAVWFGCLYAVIRFLSRLAG